MYSYFVVPTLKIENSIKYIKINKHDEIILLKI